MTKDVWLCPYCEAPQDQDDFWWEVIYDSRHEEQDALCLVCDKTYLLKSVVVTTFYPRKHE